jgi:hypothetical protein
MNRYIYIIAFLIFISNKAEACDLCGCGNGSSFFGIMPQSHRSFVGIRYGVKSFDTHLDIPGQTSHELFRKTELWGRFYPAKKLQILAFLPFNNNEQKLVAQQKTLKLNGIGDASVLANYSIVNTLMSDTLPRKVDHNLTIGFGAKLPTGKYKYDPYNDQEVGNPNFQLGTGSMDFMMNLIYTLSYKNWGLNADLTYKLNTQNSNQYQFGNKLNTNLLVFYSKKSDKSTLMPNLGLSFESSTNDRKNKKSVGLSGGNLLLGNLGMESYIKKVMFGVNYQAVIKQNLANGELVANNRLNLHITFLIK